MQIIYSDYKTRFSSYYVAASNSFHLGQNLQPLLVTAGINIAVSVSCWAAVQTQSAERAIPSPSTLLSSTFLLKHLVQTFIFPSIGLLLNTDTHFQQHPASHTCAYIHAWVLHRNHRLQTSLGCSTWATSLAQGHLSYYSFIRLHWRSQPATVWS